MNEIWKDVIGFEDCYQVSNMGRVRSKDRVMYNTLNLRNIQTYRKESI